MGRAGLAVQSGTTGNRLGFFLVSVSLEDYAAEWMGREGGGGGRGALAHGSEEGQNGVEVQEEICKGPRREIVFLCINLLSQPNSYLGGFCISSLKIVLQDHEAPNRFAPCTEPSDFFSPPPESRTILASQQREKGVRLPVVFPTGQCDFSFGAPRCPCPRPAACR